MGLPDGLDMTSCTLLVLVTKLAAVHVTVASVALETATALHPVTGVPFMVNCAVNDGVNVPPV